MAKVVGLVPGYEAQTRLLYLMKTTQEKSKIRFLPLPFKSINQEMERNVKKKEKQKKRYKQRERERMND